MNKCVKKVCKDLKMIPESSSLTANILLKRIETEKSKFEELYAYLDILEEKITEKGYHFPSLEKPLRENFEQFKPKIFKEERDRNLEKIQAPSAIKREVTGACTVWLRFDKVTVSEIWYEGVGNCFEEPA
ncbi:MAG: hypothetical protein KAT65_16025 [Methanophagales archaeon]|nr:hypothetical protein [Methanophagales archaeon]